MSHYIAVSDKPSISIVNISMIEERIDSKYYTNFNLSIIKRILDSGLLVKSLNELSRKITQGPNPKFIEDKRGIPCLKTRNIYDDEITFEGCNYISESEYKNLERFKILYGDILIAIQGEGSIGKSNIYTKKEKAVFSRPIGLVRVKDSIVDPFYLSAFLRSFYGKRLLERGISGSSGQLVLAVEYIKTIPIPLPNESIQNYIGNKIRKAEELREEAKRLKEEAKKIFINSLNLFELENQIRSVNRYNWVRLNEDRLDLNYNHPALTTIKNHLVKYKAEKLNVIAEIVGGFAFPSNLFNATKGNDVIKIAEINEFDIQYEQLSKVSVSEVNKDLSKYVCNVGELVYAMTGATIGKTAINISHPLLVNQRVGIIRSKSEIPNGYLLVYFNSLIGKYFSKFLNTGVAQPNISIDDVGEFIVPILEQNLMDQIHNKIIQSLKNNLKSKQLISEAKQDVENLIEGKFDESKISEGA